MSRDSHPCSRAQGPTRFFKRSWALLRDRLVLTSNLWKEGKSFSRKCQRILWPPKETEPAQPSFEGGSANQKTLHALIIGINKYASEKITDLGGAVADANHVEAFLRASVAKPNLQVTKLIDEQASRKMIVEAIRDLARKGQKDDPFLIFYAGHGTEVKNAEQQTIQAILPCDVNVIDDNVVNKKKAVHPIPDTTLGALIADLSEKIGDNITIILDSCYSGSGTRDGEAPRDPISDLEYPARFVALKNYYLPNGLDRDVLPPFSSRVRQAVIHKEGPSSSNCILLAACQSNEFAREHRGRGQFTRALLDLLDNTPFHELAYSEVVPRLGPFKHQHPQCEGDNAHRHFFGGKIRCLRHCYHVQQKDGAFTLNVGELSGISEGATFDIYATRSSAGNQSEMIATMAALSVSPFATALRYQGIRHIFPLPRGAVAFQTNAGIMKKPTSKLRVTLNGEHPDVSSAVTKWQDNPNEITFDTVTPLDHIAPCLELRYCPTTTTSLAMEILDPRAVDHGLLNTTHAVFATPEMVLAVLRAAAHFYYHLDLVAEPRDKMKEFKDDPKEPADGLNCIRDSISIDLNKLEGRRNSRRPVGDNLYSNNLIALDIDPSQRSLYGIKLTNKMSYSLYVYAFYFDFTELSILKLYGRRAGQDHLDPDLHPANDAPNNTLTIGFGSGGVLPICFSVPRDQDVDVGCIKFFLSTQPIDLEHVQRTGSTFMLVETKGSAFEDDSTARGASRWDDSESVDAWGTIQIPVKLSEIAARSV